MKLSKIYSNKNNIFEPILFNTNINSNKNLLNVIFAEALDSKNTEKDLHNLGKSILIELIDFVLLKKVHNNHFLIKHKNKFKDFSFYLEILLNSGKYLTVKRDVSESTKISIMLTLQFGQRNKQDSVHFTAHNMSYVLYIKTVQANT